MAQLLYACLLLLLLEPAVLAQCPPDPIEDVCQQSICSGCAYDDRFPDLEDCHRFYICRGDGTYLPAPCPGDEVFNYALQDCQESSEGIPCPPCPLTQECVYECPEEGFLEVAHRVDCNTFYECSDGSVTVKHCVDELKPFFDGTICQADQTLCCSCQPSCDEEGLYLTNDPIDCRKYWICDIPTTTTTTTESSDLLFNAGTPKSRPEISDTCAEGKVFDIVAQKCLEGAPCVTTCPNVVDANGCIDPFICVTTGTFPKCKNQCIQEYYDCKEVTYPEYKDPDLCYTGTVFNPDNHLCINLDDCPYQ